MSTNPVSFRFPFESHISDMPTDHQYVIRTLWNAITDLQGAVPLLKTQVDSKVDKTTTSTSSSSTSSSSTGSTATTASVTKAISAVITAFKFSLKASSPGGVNDLSGVTSYATQNSDYGKMLVFDDASPIAVSLSVLSSLPSISLPFYCVIFNDGTGTITCTPSSGLINGNADDTIMGGGFGILYYDGSNFYMAATSAPGSGVTSLDGITGAITLVAGSNITITPGSPSAQDITIAASTGTSYIKGTVTVVASGTSGTFAGSNTVTGAGVGMSVAASAPALIQLCGTLPVSWVADVQASNVVEVQVTLPNLGGPSWGSIQFYVTVFP